jgi:outer membrane protein assembly factor BamD (BamD/ComL family)
MKININYIVLTLLLMVGCTNPQQKMKDVINEKEAEFGVLSEQQMSKEKADPMIKLYLDFVAQYQDDTISADYLFKSAELSAKSAQFEQAVDLYGRVQRFPNFRKTPTALFLQGFIMENDLHKPQIAKSYYEKFLSKYPNHPLAKDVRLVIQSLELSPEELVKQFEQNSIMSNTK